MNEDEKLGAGYIWFAAKTAEHTPNVCSTRDVFQARFERLFGDLLRMGKKEEEAALLIAVVGELGNNCFDHNLGQWKDIPGCWFDHQIEKNATSIIVADRGQGIWSSLKRVDPTLMSDQAALETAFAKRLSGRSPEQRGNGLKFVRTAINGNEKRAILTASGKGCIEFGGLRSSIRKRMDPLLASGFGDGTFSWIVWE